MKKGLEKDRQNLGNLEDLWQPVQQPTLIHDLVH
jgi:hypothetical protein